MKRLIFSCLFLGFVVPVYSQKGGSHFNKGDILGRAMINAWGENGKINFNGQESDKPKNSSTKPAYHL